MKQNPKQKGVCVCVCVFVGEGGGGMEGIVAPLSIVI